MSAAFIPSIKDLANRVTVDRAAAILAAALRRKTAREVERLMQQELQKICPDHMLLDTVSRET